jgi:NAD(P)-dependent dehydrogenase (short-subunit alcohol dehydrogenase family)
MRLNGSVALVTGANRGMGARLITQLLYAGEPRWGRCHAMSF